jgi:hypothetical protein
MSVFTDGRPIDLEKYLNQIRNEYLTFSRRNRSKRGGQNINIKGNYY